MISANELRIGSTIIDYFGTEQTLDADSLEVLLSIRNFEELQGIPLTPEVLKRAGLRRYGIDGTDYSVAGQEFGFAKGGFYLLFEGQLASKGMKYLHELQNLVFALLGEELQIKEA